MELSYILGALVALPVAAFVVYLCGRIFGLGFAASLKQVNTTKQETKRGTRQ